VFIVKVVELDDDKRVSTREMCQAYSVSLLFVFSSSQNNWNYVCLSNLIGTKNATGCF
jgi:hypothetical protein